MPILEDETESNEWELNKMVRPPSPAMWYDANGHEWGQLGPNGERLDQDGNPLPERKPNYLLAFFWLVLLVGLMVAVALAYIDSNESPTNAVPFSTPTTYGHPQTCYHR